jgi:hypothetical protein
MKPNKLISALAIFTLFFSPSSGQNTSCNVKKAFRVTEGSSLQFTNKYGDLNIVSSNNDTLSVCAIITILQDNRELVLKNMKLITVNIEKLKDTVYVSTIYDKKFFSEDSRKGRKSFSTDYLIKMPAYMNMDVKDEFGNISIDELNGSLNAIISQGSLNAKKLTRGNTNPVNSIYADHSKIVIADMNWMIMNLINCPSVEIEKAQALNLKSSISKIRIGETSSLVSNSKSDNINIKSMNNIFADGVYSTYQIGKLNSQMKTAIRYGAIMISDLNKNFTTIDIKADHALVSIKPGPETSFKADLSMSDGIVEIPAVKYPGIFKSSGTAENSYLGLAGNNDTKSLIKIRATGGKISIE